jgi:signal transduction histidine kinase
MLDSKKSFVRYISHEIRTPLNIVFMGLQFLKSNQEKEECTVREFSNKGKNYHQTTLESQQCVADMHSACGSAIAILNDLLLFDKLEDGKLVLDKSQIEVGHFLRNSLSPFNAQVRVIVKVFVYWGYINN